MTDVTNHYYKQSSANEPATNYIREPIHIEIETRYTYQKGNGDTKNDNKIFLPGSRKSMLNAVCHQTIRQHPDKSTGAWKCAAYGTNIKMVFWPSSFRK